MNRAGASIKNAVFGLLSQACILIGQFAVQTVFVRELSIRYLGANGLFTNLMSFLSFAELGIGSAITFSLYKPIAEKDYEQINAVMGLFRKVYQAIGVFILLFGLLLSFFVNRLVRSGQSVPNIQVLFILFLLGTVVSYFFTYTRTLIIANQCGYIDSINQLIFKGVQYVVQILVLIFVKEYEMYLVITIIGNLMANISITRQAYKKFPYLRLSGTDGVKSSILNEMKHNVLGTVSNKIGEIVVFGTDNILISKFIGLVTVGVYSNYTLIVNGLTSVLNQGFNAVISSFGNLGVSSSKEHQKSIFFDYLYVVSLITYVIASTFFSLVQPFVSFWFGKELLFSNWIVLLVVVNFIFTQMRQATLGFISALGLFWPMRYKAIVEATLNLVLSLLFIWKFAMGVPGVLLGTLCSTLLVNVWWEPWVLFRYGFKTQMSRYFSNYCKYLAVVLITQGLIYEYGQVLKVSSLIGFVIWGILLVGLYSGIFILIFFKTKENRYLMKKIIERFRS